MYENDTQYTPLAVLAGVDTGAYDMDAPAAPPWKRPYQIGRAHV